MPSGNRKKISLGLAASVLLLAGVLGAVALFDKPETAGVSSMAGYVSRYHPAHMASDEAWRLAQSEDGAVVLDLRSQASYLERHVSGAVNVQLETLADYAAGHLPDKDRLILCYCFCGDRGGSALAAYDLLTEMGYTRVFYTEPEDEWSYEGTLAPPADGSGHRVVSGAEAEALYAENPGAVLLDVRNLDEYQEKHIDGSILIPAAELAARLSELPDKDAVIIVYCKAGARSATACEILIDAGYTRVYDMQRVDDWPAPSTTP